MESRITSGSVVTVMPLPPLALLRVDDRSVQIVASKQSQSNYDMCMATAWSVAGAPVYCPVNSKMWVPESSHS